MLFTLLFFKIGVLYVIDTTYKVIIHSFFEKVNYIGGILKICSIVAEYNPFHNGHLRQINYIKEVLKPDYIAVFLSGNFTQRGEGAVLDKFARARHAVLAGADIVFELPTVFATQTAEIFASGAVKLINALPFEKSICFGSECGDKKAIVDTAFNLLNETPEYKKILKDELKKGTSLIQAREIALEKTSSNFNGEILKSPNNVLGVEYVKAILKNDYPIAVEVIKRDGLDYNDDKIKKGAPSALAVRTALMQNKKAKIKKAVPPYVYKDLKGVPEFDREIIYSLISTPKSEIKKAIDCTEGLENRIKALCKDNFTVDSLLEKLKTKRYTSARLKRILLSTMLKIDEKLVHTALKKDLYLKVLAIKEDKIDLLSKLSSASYPLITRKSDLTKLSGTALEVFEKDVFATEIYSSVTDAKINENNMIIV